jgi:hypothetical protein
VLFLHTEVSAAVLDESIVLNERVGIDEKINTLAGSELATSMLSINALLATTKLGLGLKLRELIRESLRRSSEVPLLLLSRGRSGTRSSNTLNRKRFTLGML